VRVDQAEIEVKAAERLTFFSDAVVAIAITLLALELPIPMGESNREFWQDVNANQADYIAFFISFTVISAHWVGHHRVFRYVVAVTPAVRRWIMLWLFMIVLMPFTTKVLSESGAFQSRFTVYALGQALAGIFFLLTLHAVVKARVLDPATPKDLVANGYERLGVVSGMFLVSIPVAFVTRWAYLCWVAIPFVGSAVHSLRTRRPA
jgi:uncharacterized membrane protein